jgi:predicted lipoprotein with Yx(FWY)xxD motif
METLWQGVRRLGALSLLVVGGVHLQQYRDGYAEIATIGELFLLNVVGAAVMGAGLLLPVERITRRWGGAIVALLALGGVALSATSYVMLLIAERRPLFGFMEPGFNPDAIMVARVSEVATILLLGGFLLALMFGRAGPRRRPADEDVDGPRPLRSRDQLLSRVAAPGVVVVAALVLSACGSDGGDDTTAAPQTGGDGATVSVAEIGGKTVLVDAEGAALYVSDEEAKGEVLCVTDGCVSFWVPVTVDGGAPTGDVSGGELSVVSRPDGKSQVTFDNRPLYTFSQDKPGQVKGDGLSDSFDGQTLTWHVVTADGATGSESPDSSEGDDPGPYNY